MQSKILIDLDDNYGSVVRFSGVPSFGGAFGELDVKDKLVRRFLDSGDLFVREVVSSEDNSVQILRRAALDTLLFRLLEYYPVGDRRRGIIQSLIDDEYGFAEKSAS